MTTPATHTSTLTTLVVGAGKTGRRIADRLRGAEVPHRLASRSASVPFDWDDRESWAPALDGAQAVYLSFAPDLAVPGASETVGALARQAVDSGARRLVLLSGRGEAEAQEAEKAVQDAGAEWTIVRASWFDQNFSEGHLLDPLLTGTLALPVGEVGEPFIDADDIAEVAVAALTEAGHAGELYEATGPRLLSFAEAVAAIAAVSGRELRFESVDLAAYRVELEREQVPAEVVELLGYLFSEVLDGRNESLGDGVQRALGRPPRDFAEFARAAAASGAWA
ncbi:NAD(P)H-binding protein [Compostimonas suwonensis]|nr:NAD(P)H-binding protein [Compostimonas suwonensis]